MNKQKFIELKAKYKVPENGFNYSDSDFLYFILAKAEISFDLLNDYDWIFLQDQKFGKVYDSLKQRKDNRDQEIQNLINEFNTLYNKYSFIFIQKSPEVLGLTHRIKSSNYFQESLKSKFYSILKKLDLFGNLNQEEIAYLKENKLDEKVYNKLLDFLSLKKKYKVTEYKSISIKDKLYSILSKLENKIQLTDKDLIFINHNKLNNLLEVYQIQQKQYEEEFVNLKEKYSCNHFLESSIDNPLYKILKNIELGQSLTNQEINWLKSNHLENILNIADFIALKVKYQATKNEDLSINSHLYKVLKKIDNHIPLPESDLNFLKKKKLTETFNISVEKYADYLISQIELGEELTQDQLNWIEKYQRQDLIKIGKTKHFKKLKEKYGVSIISDNNPESQLYLILQKLDQNQRLDALDIAYLQDKDLFYPRSKISICFNGIEAQFYEADYEKTGNKWNLPNISSHWRKANQPKKALNATENVNFDSIKENKLKSAILTTRGGAFRDLSQLDNAQLDNAEKCAKKAIEYQPESHHPYTLMGAIYYDRYNHYEGDKWFREAEKRGASRESIDVEIKRSLERMKNKEKREQMAKKLLKKDAKRYAWANKYLKTQKS